VNTQAAAVAAALQTKDDEEETLRAALEVQTRRAEDAEAHLDAAQVQHREEQQGGHAKYRQQCSADVTVHGLQRDLAAARAAAAAAAAALQTKDDEEETLRAALEVQTRRAEDAEAHLDAAQVQHREEQQGAHAKYRQQCSADVIVHDLQRELAAARAAAAAAAAETAAARQDASEATRSMREVTAASAAVEEEMEARASARARDHDRDKEEAAMCRLREVPKPCYPLP
jgi:SWI/SNF-related matrix-associated actin-dependent regulator 1 of chromatin subfamily A